MFKLPPVKITTWRIHMNKNNKEKVILYNLIFPIWLIVWMPGWWWLLLIPANFAIDFFVLKKCFEKKEVENKKELLKKYSWKTCIFGFLSDFIGTAFLFVVYGGVSLAGDYLYENGNEQVGKALLKWAGSSMISSWNNPIAFVINVVGVILAAYFIFLFNRNMLRKNADIGEENARYTARRLALITAPYLFLLPFYFY